MTFKIATWNVNSIKVRLPHVEQWLKQHPVDVLALQETKTINENFPQQEIKDFGYHVYFNGQKTYNGVAILSRHLASDIEVAFPDYDDPQCRVLAATIKDIRIVNLYVPNGSSVGSEKYEYKLTWWQHLLTFTKKQLKKYEKVILLGDYNIAPEDRDVHDPSVWVGNVLVSPKEREAFQALLKLGLVDSYRLFDQPEEQYTWWDFRTRAFSRNRGLRIDHILISKALSTQCKKSTIDIEPRTWDRPSDHTIVVAEL